MMFYLAIGALVAGLLGGWTIKGWQEDAAKVATMQAIEESRQAFAKENGALAERLEKKLANLKIVNRTIHNEVQKEIHEKPVYLNADCAIPATGVGLLNAARGHAPGKPAGERDAAVPNAPGGDKDKPPAR